MADKPTFDFGGAFSAAGDQLGKYAGQIPAPIDSVGLTSDLSDAGKSIANSPGGQAVSGGLHFGDAFSAAGKSMKGGLMKAKQSAGDMLGNLSQPVQDLMDTVRVFYNQLPNDWQKYVTTVYGDSDQRMKNVEQRVSKAFGNLTSGMPQSYHELSDSVNSSLGTSAPQTRAQPNAGPPDDIAPPVDQQMAAVTASKRGPVKNPLASHPLANSPEHREAATGDKVPISANRLADNAGLGDAVQFFMSNDNMNRADAVKAAQTWLATKVDQTIVDRGSSKSA